MRPSNADSGPEYMYCCEDWCNEGVLLAVPGAEVRNAKYGNSHDVRCRVVGGGMVLCHC